MAQKTFALEARESGPPFHNSSKILHLLLSLKTKSNLGLGEAATADYVKLLSQTLASFGLWLFMLEIVHCIYVYCILTSIRTMHMRNL